MLLKHCSILSDYDFQSQISVDILGRIFENSLSEIEEIIQDITPNETARGLELAYGLKSACGCENVVRRVVS